MSQNCKYCQKSAVYHRKISNELVCATHFCKTIENKIRKTVRKYNMFNPQEKVVVGVSGGKDSLVLLYNVLKLQKRNPNSPKVEAILIDEGIKGYREESTNIAIQICKKWDVPLHIVKFSTQFGSTLDNVADQTPHLEVNACTICGTVRRRLLNDTARDLQSNKLAIGHNLDDITETFLQNIIRNDLRKLSSKPPYGNIEESTQKLIQRVKPLMQIPEAEITLYCYYKQIPIQTTPCPYVENFFILRQKVQTFLNILEENSAEVKYNLLNLNEQLFSILHKENSSTSGLNDSELEKPLLCLEDQISLCESCGEPKGPTRKICYYCELKQKLGLNKE